MARKPKAKPVVESRSDVEPLTPAGIIDIRWSIRESKHDPAQARRLLEIFVGQGRASEDRRAIGEVEDHLREAIKRYLADPKEGRLEAALGLTAPQHRPPSPEIDKKHDFIALRILQERLRGRLQKAACAEAGREYAVSASQAEKAWLSRRDPALHIECFRRRELGRKAPLFDASEVKILCRIYGAEVARRIYISGDAVK